MGDENDVGDKVGRDQSWHKWPSAPRALFCQPTRFSATLHGTVHFGDVWCALLNNLWCGVIWCIIVHFGEVFVWFCMVWYKVWNGMVRYGANGMVLYSMVQTLSVSLHPFLACKTGQSWEVSSREMFAQIFGF